MNRIVQCGLVAGLLIFGAMSVGSAADENAPVFSDDYRQGFYDAGYYLGQANAIGGSLAQFYFALGGEEAAITEENKEMVDYYNNETRAFNQEVVPFVNGMIVQIFGDDDNVTSVISLAKLPLIS
ncbi:MAG: hypothetical protein U9N48_05850 [Euryarchaeota archaeon]|nr:hypothetical protein [Euryarchaeota archaeon]